MNVAGPCPPGYGKAAKLKDFLLSRMLFELSQRHHCDATPYYFNIQAPSPHNPPLSGGASITDALTCGCGSRELI